MRSRLTTMVAGSLLAMAVAGGIVLAAEQPGPAPAAERAQSSAPSGQENRQEPAYTGSIVLPSQDRNGAEDRQASGGDAAGDRQAGDRREADGPDTAYAGLARIDAAQARAAMEAAYPAATLEPPTLQDENGFLVWGAEVALADGTRLDVKVDAGTGTVLSADRGDGEDEGQVGGSDGEAAGGHEDGPDGPGDRTGEH